MWMYLFRGGVRTGGPNEVIRFGGVWNRHSNWYSVLDPWTHGCTGWCIVSHMHSLACKYMLYAPLVHTVCIALHPYVVLLCYKCSGSVPPDNITRSLYSQTTSHLGSMRWHAGVHPVMCCVTYIIYVLTKEHKFNFEKQMHRNCFLRPIIPTGK